MLPDAEFVLLDRVDADVLLDTVLTAGEEDDDVGVCVDFDVVLVVDVGQDWAEIT